MIKVYINNIETTVSKDITVLQACEQQNIHIPRFCYHEKLSIAGNCRMCLVEIEKSSKPMASCALPVMDGMKIYTDTPMVKKARESVMEFLLLNHPLDCPICDQGGECDLQDQSMSFGNDRGRYYEYKRAVEDKNCGPLVKTIMTRCIHCTRCVRFASEIAGVPDLGMTGRGNHSEIGFYVEKAIYSELSGNLIDLCPVGALTSKPYSFTARPWELDSIHSIDIFDGIGSNIRIDRRGADIMRILPISNDDINEDWLSDKARFSYDGLKNQRLTNPIVKKGNGYESVDWSIALKEIAEKITISKTITGIIGSDIPAETIVAFKDFLNGLNSSNMLHEKHGMAIDSDLRPNYLSNTTLKNIEQADVCLLIGTNPRLEGPILNVRLRRGVVENNLIVAAIGSSLDLTFPIEHLGSSTKTLYEISNEKHPFSKKLRNAKKPIIIVGSDVYQREDRDSIKQSILQLVKNMDLITTEWNGLNILHHSPSYVTALDLGFVPGPDSIFKTSIRNLSKSDIVYLIHADDPEILKHINKESFIIYQGHHGDIGASIADVILPSGSYVETNGIFINTEGRPQQSHPALIAPGQSKEGWEIIKALSDYIGIDLMYGTTKEIKNRLVEISPSIKELNNLVHSELSNRLILSQESTIIGKTVPLPLFSAIDDYYLSDVIAKHSKTMGSCSNTLINRKNNYF
jgi:NADH-quinone oxidoreductase chain G